MARYHAGRKNGAKAQEILEQGQQHNPESEPLLVALVQSYIRTGNTDSALTLAKAAVERNDQNAFAQNILGFVHIARKEYTRGEQRLRQALSLNPLSAGIHNNLAKLFMLQGKKDEAEQQLRDAIKNNPEEKKTYLTLALLYQKGREFKKAMAVYREALARDAAFGLAANNLAFLISESPDSQENLSEALTLAQNSLEGRPQDPAMLDTLGWVYFRMGEYQKALVPLEQALDLAPEADIILYHMGMLLHKTGRLQEAREKLRKALAGEADFIGRQEAEKVLRSLT